MDLVRNRKKSRLSPFAFPRLPPRSQPPQMTERRVRKPTLRALDAAESNLLAREAPPSRKRGALSPSYPSTSSSSAAAPVKRNGRPQNDKGKQAIAQQQALLQGQQQAFLVDPPEDEDGEDSGEGMDQDEPLEQDLTLCKPFSDTFERLPEAS